MQVPEPEGRITIVSPPHEEEENLFAHSQNGRQERSTQERQPGSAGRRQWTASPISSRDQSPPSGT